MANAVALTGNLEIGRIKIDGSDHITVRVDPKHPSHLFYTFLGSKGGEYEILFADDKDDLEGRDPERCVILRPTLTLGDGSQLGRDIVLVQNSPLSGQESACSNSNEPTISSESTSIPEPPLP